MRSRRTCKAGTLILAASLGVAGCSGSEEGDEPLTNTIVERVRLYDSVDDIAQDSDLVIVGTVQSSKTATEFDGMSLSLFEVEVESLHGSPTNDISVGDSVTVRQFGTGPRDAIAPLLQRGETYALFLTLTGLPDEREDQYYVTGSSAGIYGIQGDGTFHQTEPTIGESLPDIITTDDLP